MGVNKCGIPLCRCVSMMSATNYYSIPTDASSLATQYRSKAVSCRFLSLQALHCHSIAIIHDKRDWISNLPPDKVTEQAQQ